MVCPLFSLLPFPRAPAIVPLMSMNLAYYICLLAYLLLGVYSAWPITPATAKSQSSNLLLLALLVLIGWKIFGPPVHA